MTKRGNVKNILAYCGQCAIIFDKGEALRNIDLILVGLSL